MAALINEENGGFTQKNIMPDVDVGFT